MLTFCAFASGTVVAPVGCGSGVGDGVAGVWAADAWVAGAVSAVAAVSPLVACSATEAFAALGALSTAGACCAAGAC